MSTIIRVITKVVATHAPEGRSDFVPAPPPPEPLTKDNLVTLETDAFEALYDQI